MKIALIATVASMVATTALAGSHDEAEVAAVATQPAPSTIVDWSGPYVGGSVAAFQGSMPFCDNRVPDYRCDDLQLDTSEPEAAGGMFGISAGYDWQNNSMVYGVMGDLMFGDLSGSADSTTDPSYGCVGTCDLEINGVAMLRGRIGHATNSWLFYGSAGVAATRVGVRAGGGDVFEGTVTNPVVGIGGEYMISDNLSAGLEVIQIIEKADPVILDDFCGGECGATDFSATAVRASVSYRF